MMEGACGLADAAALAFLGVEDDQSSRIIFKP
jgi:hypothetical protein